MGRVGRRSGVEVDPIDDAAKSSYRKYGFVPLLDAESHLYLPIVTASDAIGKA